MSAQTSTGPDAATLAQMTAADPERSTWLTANAGSGKTRVLTDRVARLLLGGADPARILCLTYTKAAAAEMQVRLLRRLGEWAMLPEPDLRAALEKLGAPAPNSAALSRARRLFARAIETPGGLKIQTIHAFCAALLRRFPLEAGVPHQFTELDDRSATILREDILEAMAEDDGEGRAALDALTRLHGGHEVGKFLGGVAARAAAFDPPLTLAGALQAAGLPPGYNRAALLAEVFEGDEGDLFTALIPHLHRGGTNDNKLATRLAALQPAMGTDSLIALESVLLTGAKAAAGAYVPKGDKLVTKPTRERTPSDLLERLSALAEAVADARPRRLALAAAERSAALHRFAAEFLRRYRAAKQARGWLDFDDLITLAGRLLNDPSAADWVLFRLDGGIDHVLVDEAQDTSPGQWQVIDRLTGEFTSGQGARRDRPTLFVVGDRKQSIYSFQGADLDEFDRRHQQFTDAFEAIGQPMQQLSLAHSFRSSPAVLAAVDASFQPPHDVGLGGAPAHIAFHENRPGRVDLWPVFEDEKPQEPENYDDPVNMPAPHRAAARLAEAIAQRIRAMIDQGECLPKGDGARPIHEGDILILVQRRSDLFGAMIAACKQAGLAVAGADRVRLGAELAVSDIRATLAFLATPEDDLSLAQALRSPLFALSEAELFALAQPRRGYLWAHMRAQDDNPAVQVLRDLRDQADYLRPFDLIERLLTRHRGRERLIARLGPEAEDGIDMLLAQALAYEHTEVPSLTGFLVWLAAGDLEVKRSTESGAGAIRVMTAHGAKGLEAPIVFLPDCAVRGASSRGKELLVAPDQPALWRGRAEERTEPYQALIADEDERTEKERARLLYVAMTRAESWLIVAAAGAVDKPCWYSDVARGLGTLPVETVTEPALPEPLLRHSSGDWPAPCGGSRRDVGTDHSDDPGAVSLPDWVLSRPAPAPRAAPAVTATGLGGEKSLLTDATELGASEPGAAQPSAGAELLAAQNREAAIERGTALHRLLELLPEHDPAAWPAIAARLGLDDPALLAAAERALAVVGLDPPSSTVLREVDLRSSPLWPGTGPFRGSIDRLSVSDALIRVTDYKSNAQVPSSPGDTPQGILRQMAAYRAALGRIYPGRPIECAILWTADATLMILPDDLLQSAFDAAGAELARLDGR